MILLPKAIYVRYIEMLVNRGLDANLHAEYVKWLRYYLDFCARYVITDVQTERLALFLAKLKSKKQSPAQCDQAAHAVSLYFEIQRQTVVPSREREFPEEQMDELPRNELVHEPASQYLESAPSAPPVVDTPSASTQPRYSQYVDAGYREKTSSPEWDEVLAALAAEIKIRHYSRKTLKTYANWSRRFQYFLKNKPPQEVGTVDVKQYLTYLAVECEVAASTQNQAFNSLLFLFRHALKKDFGDLRDVPRAKKSLYNFRSKGCRL